MGRCSGPNKSDGQSVAIKVAANASATRSEVELMGAVSHDCVVMLLARYEDLDSIYMVLEFCDFGNLAGKRFQVKRFRT